jgi:branched-chain amino acid transport system substrate-binding protein
MPSWQQLATHTSEVPINQCWESAYFQVMLFAKALIEAEDIHTESLLKVLRGMEVEAPQGRVRIDPDNNHCWVYSRIGRSRADGDFEIVKESKRTVRPDPYLMSYAISAL